MAITTTAVSSWKCNQTSGNLVDSIGSNTLTNVNSVPFVTGKINNGADLELSSSQYFSIADGSQSGLDFAGNFSISFWIKLEQLPSTAGSQFDIVAKDNVSVSRSYSVNAQTSDKLQLVIFNTPNQREGVTTGAFFVSGDVGNWVFVTCTYNSTTGATVIYKNASSQAVTNFGSTTTALNSTAPFSIGARFASSVAQNFTDGVIDEVVVWSGVLSGAEVTELYNGGAGLSYPIVLQNSNFLMFM